MDQVQFVEYAVIWSALRDHINSNFLKAVFPKFYFVHF